VCGKDSRPEQGALPTPEAIDAGRREAEWLAQRPEVAHAEWEAAHQAEREGRVAREARIGGWAPPSGASEPTRPAAFASYRDVGTWAQVLRGWLLAFTLLTAVELALEFDHLSLLNQTDPLDYLGSQDVAGAETRLGIILLVGVGAFVFCVVFFLIWFYRAYRNLIPLGALQLRFGEGWAIGSWFIPFFNLVRPKQIANDLWRGSDPATPSWPHPGTWQSKPVSPLLHWWWAVYLLSGFFGRASARAYGDFETWTAAHRGTTLAIIASLLEIVSALLCIWVVTSITRRQQARAAVLAELPETAPEAVPQPVA
jgi:Domain of unknown function (DUF4328)